MGADPGEADRPAWLDVDDLEPPSAVRRPSRTTWLLAGATLPWLAVAVLLVRPPGGHDDPGAIEGPPSGRPTASPAAATPLPAPGTSALAPTGTAPSASILSSGALIAVDEDEARAVAVVAARRWLTTVGPDAAAPPPDATGGDGGDAGAAGGVYAEHLVVEGVDHPGPGAAVVTVRALVLRVAGDVYEGVEVRRVAVPLRFDAGGAAPAGDPYLLPLDEPVPAPIESTGSIDDPDLLLLAGEALVAAGYRVDEVHALHRTASWPLVVTADVGVGDAPARRLGVWLRPHLGGLVVAGTRPGPAEPHPASGPHPSDPPSSSEPHRHDHEEVAP